VTPTLKGRGYIGGEVGATLVGENHRVIASRRRGNLHKIKDQKLKTKMTDKNVKILFFRREQA
jgi:hypothetical protein